MEYNTTRNKLVLKEYGRNIQKLIEYATSIEDEKRRNEVSKAIIDLMGQMNPHLRNVEEFRHKLWDHLVIVSGYEIEVESPYPKPDREVIEAKPKHIGYPKHDIKRKQYGKLVERMIAKASEMEDEEKKKGFTEVIGNFMKMAHNNWSRENVNDEIIINDIQTLSNNQLALEESMNLDALHRSHRKKRMSQERERPAGPGRGPGGPRRGPGGYKKGNINKRRP